MADIYGTPGNDNLVGTEDYDYIYGYEGDDTLSGLGSDDNLYGQEGNDVLNGGDGNDYLSGGNGNNQLNGGSGDDYIFGDAGVNVIDGGDGDDLFRLYTYAGSNPVTVTYTNVNNGSVTGGDSSGTTFKNIEHTEIFTDAGDDVINVTAAIGGTSSRFYWANYIYAYGGNDTITTGSGRDYVRGDAGNDTINTGDGDDDVSGDDGNDIINTGAGNDNISGSNGTDTVNAGDGDDTIQYNYYGNSAASLGTIDGGAGVDFLSLSYYSSDSPIKISFANTTTGGIVTGGLTFKNIERVSIQGGRDNDSIDIKAMDSSLATSSNNLYGYEGNDKLTGSAYADYLSGGTGNDTLAGGAGVDTLYGESGGDSLNGGAGDDTLAGGTENDKLTGGAGNDYLSGESESDTLTGVDTTASLLRPGTGEFDYLSGGSGRDYFVLGDKTRVYYDDGNASVDGTADFAYIADYQLSQKDNIRLQGSSLNYELVADVTATGSNGGTYSGTGIYRKGATNELIAIVGNYSSTNTVAQVEAGLQFLV
jgi:Ca2+-binding RTX toxin-like protein